MASWIKSFVTTAFNSLEIFFKITKKVRYTFLYRQSDPDFSLKLGLDLCFNYSVFKKIHFKHFLFLSAF
jgi:hypothetical protein